MGLGTLFALTTPGLAVLLVVLAVVERVASGLRRASPLHRERRPALSAAGADVLSTALDPGRAVDVEQRLASELMREDETDGAPPRSRIDLDAGVAHLVLRPPR
ncbi:DUF6191 domain-containing protein [Modestobacter marinus]|uniref:DUF6191 domain-containing protein n=1 Tax=Modestobacter marinus TaxID=477641 RepID=UPI001C960B31|nr:DUF6191 domain-containing protein [Modestobacter marinus]